MTQDANSEAVTGFLKACGPHGNKKSFIFCSRTYWEAGLASQDLLIRTQHHRGSSLGLVLCSHHLEILNNLELGTPRVPSVLGPANYCGLHYTRLATLLSCVHQPLALGYWFLRQTL